MGPIAEEYAMAEDKPICRRVRENLSAHFDGELKQGARRLIDEHLAECEECRKYYQELKETWQLLDELEEPIVRRELADSLWTQIEAEKKAGWRGRLERWTGASGLVAGLAASAAAAVFLFGLYLGLKPISHLPTPVERETILYMDVLRDLETLNQLEMVTYMRELGTDLASPADGSPVEGADG